MHERQLMAAALQALLAPAAPSTLQRSMDKEAGRVNALMTLRERQTEEKRRWVAKKALDEALPELVEADPVEAVA